MDIFDIKECLNNYTILYDTREHQNKLLSKRLSQMECATERHKLDFGDYSIKCLAPNNTEITLENQVVIERKYGLTELAMCFGKERARFEREFERAKAGNCTVYLLVEDANWSILYNDMAYKTYVRSNMPRKSVLASIRAWQARYNLHIEFCPKEISGWVIRDILYRELKERLEHDKFD